MCTCFTCNSLSPCMDIMEHFLASNSAAGVKSKSSPEIVQISHCRRIHGPADKWWSLFLWRGETGALREKSSDQQDIATGDTSYTHPCTNTGILPASQAGTHANTLKRGHERWPTYPKTSFYRDTRGITHVPETQCSLISGSNTEFNKLSVISWVLFVCMGRFVPLSSCQVLIQSVSWADIYPARTQDWVKKKNFC